MVDGALRDWLLGEVATGHSVVCVKDVHVAVGAGGNGAEELVPPFSGPGSSQTLHHWLRTY
jgi:hypothetical protein